MDDLVTPSSQDEQPSIDLPDECTYVCSATGYAPNNLVPLNYIGPYRVRAMVVLLGADESAPAEPMRNEAERRADKLWRFATQDLGLAMDTNLFVVRGDPDQLIAWEEAADTAIACGYPIICNLTGGTKQMAFGVKHFLDSKTDSTLYVTMNKSPQGALLIRCSKGVLQTQKMPQPNNVVGFDICLALAGKVELIDSKFKKRQRQNLYKNTDKIVNIATNALEEDNRHIVDTINLLNSEKNGSNIIFDSETKHRQSEELFDRGGDLGLFTGNIVKSGFAKRFITGLWLEYYIFNRISSALSLRNNLWFGHSICIGLDGMANEYCEIDIGILHNDQLHLIEVKQSTRNGYISSKIKEFGRKRELGGIAARGFFVAPLLRPEPAHAREWETVAREHGVELLIGSGAIDELIERVASLR